MQWGDGRISRCQATPRNHFLSHSGGSTIALASPKGKKIETIPTVHANKNEGVLTYLPKHCIDVTYLEAQGNAEEKFLLGVLTGRTPISAVFPPQLQPKRGVRKISHFMMQHLARMDEAVTERSEQIRHFLHVFTTEKKDQTLRLIQNARPLSELCVAPPKMALPALDHFVDELLGSNFAATCDGRGYFFQFPLPEDLRQFFGMRIAGRGAVWNSGDSLNCLWVGVGRQLSRKQRPTFWFGGVVLPG